MAIAKYAGIAAIYLSCWLCGELLEDPASGSQMIVLEELRDYILACPTRKAKNGILARYRKQMTLANATPSTR